MLARPRRWITRWLGYLIGDHQTLIAAELISHWNLGEHLPKAFQQHFLVIVSDYLLRRFQHQKALSNTPADNNMVPSDKNVTSNKHLVNSYLAQRLFHVIHDIQSSPSLENSQRQVGTLLYVRIDLIPLGTDVYQLCVQGFVSRW